MLSGQIPTEWPFGDWKQSNVRDCGEKLENLERTPHRQRDNMQTPDRVYSSGHHVRLPVEKMAHFKFQHTESA